MLSWIVYMTSGSLGMSCWLIQNPTLGTCQNWAVRLWTYLRRTMHCSTKNCSWAPAKQVHLHSMASGGSPNSALKSNVETWGSFLTRNPLHQMACTCLPFFSVSTRNGDCFFFLRPSWAMGLCSASVVPVLRLKNCSYK